MSDANTHVSPGWPLLALQTIVAAVLSLVVYLVVFVIAHVVLYFVNKIFNDFNPDFAHFSAQVMASFMAVSSARLACDAVLKHYSSKAICVMFCGLAIASLVLEVMNEPLGLKTLADLIVLTVTGVAAYYVFWKRMDLT